MDFRYFLSIILTINIVFIRCSQGDRYGELIYAFGHSAIIGENLKFKCHKQHAHKSMALFFAEYRLFMSSFVLTLENKRQNKISHAVYDIKTTHTCTKAHMYLIQKTSYSK